MSRMKRCGSCAGGGYLCPHGEALDAKYSYHTSDTFSDIARSPSGIAMAVVCYAGRGVGLPPPCGQS
jgi:hypothetical protein